jgi:hypothetical protein
MPLALLVDADQGDLETLLVQRVQDVFRRLQRDLVFGRTATENDANPDPAHAAAAPAMRVRDIVEPRPAWLERPTMVQPRRA